MRIKIKKKKPTHEMFWSSDFNSYQKKVYKREEQYFERLKIMEDEGLAYRTKHIELNTKPLEKVKEVLKEDDRDYLSEVIKQAMDKREKNWKYQNDYFIYDEDDYYMERPKFDIDKYLQDERDEKREQARQQKRWEEYKKDKYTIVGCGKCPECIQQKQNDWVTKFELELKRVGVNNCCFLNPTYKVQPRTQGENKQEIQNFIKRLRKAQPQAKFKYLSCGEYGAKRGRIHGHILVIGWRPNDLKYHKPSGKNNALYISKTVNKAWNGVRTKDDNCVRGFIKIGKVVTNDAVKYCTFYGIKEAKYTHATDKENNKELYEYIQKMNRCEVPEDKEIRNRWKLAKMAEFNTFSKNIGWEQFLEEDYLGREMDKIGERKIPTYWLYKYIWNQQKEPQYQHNAVKTLHERDLFGNEKEKPYRCWDTIREDECAFDKARKEYYEHRRRVLHAIKILKDRQDFYNEYIRENYGEKDMDEIQAKINEINTKNAIKNMANRMKSLLKQALDYQ